MKKIEDKNVVSNKEKLREAKVKLNNKKLEKIAKSKWTYIIIALVIILVSISIFFIVSYVNSLRYKPYYKFEEKMKIYGFDTMYDNKSPKTEESVSISEALKLVLGATFNTYDISDFAIENNDYKDSTWTEYAEACGIIKTDINSVNYNNKVKYIDVISYFEESKKIFLKDYSLKDTSVNLKDLTSYSSEEQIAIKDLVANKVVELFFDELKGKEYIFKGQLNELVVNFVEQFNTITNSDEKININPEKIPSNSKDFPYTLASVDKKEYEKPLSVVLKDEFLSSSQLYKYKKDNYKQIKTFAEQYFEKILNIDYNTISVEKIKEDLDPYLIFGVYDEVAQKYVKHVKDNKIIIIGSAKQVVPVFYFDGMNYRIRMKLNFEIKSSDTKENLIYLDMISGLKKTYQKNNYEILVDYCLTDAIDAKNIYMAQFELYDTIIDKESCGITKEINSETYWKEENK